LKVEGNEGIKKKAHSSYEEQGQKIKRETGKVRKFIPFREPSPLGYFVLRYVAHGIP
jgi:hypothetical protein